MASLRSLPKPLKSSCLTSAPCSAAIFAVSSVLWESSTSTSSAQATLSTASAIFPASLKVMM